MKGTGYATDRARSVPYKLVHHDLVEVPFGNRRAGIFWSRLYRGEADSVAIVTEVPGNPSLSVTNGNSRIAYYVKERFGVTRLKLFEVWPRGSNGWDVPSVKRVRSAKLSPRWTKSSRSEVEALVGASLPELPRHRELYRRVLALGGGRIEELWRPVFEAIPVEDLPPPHLPSRCEHIERFQEIVAQVEAVSGPSFEASLEAGRVFLGTITTDDIRACSYFHKARWREIADESVRIIERLGRRDAEDYAHAAEQSPLRERDRGWLASLFNDPIFIGGGSYSNGQHRGCALRFSGAERAAIATGDESLGTKNVDWTYKGDG